MNMEKLKPKKPGHRYNKKELRARGWTDELMKQHLTVKHQNGKAYYMSKEVSEKEALPQLAEVLCENRACAEKKRILHSMDDAARKIAAGHVKEVLDSAFYASEYTGGLRAVMEAGHKAFLKLLEEPLPSSLGPDPYSKDEVLKMLQKLAGCTFRDKLFTRTAKAAWVLGIERETPADFASQYLQTLTELAKADLKPLVENDISLEPASLLAIPAVQAVYPLEHDLYFCYLTYYVPDSISRELSEVLAVDPKNEYPGARCMSRRFFIHVGGTNTGKTYESLQRLKEAPTGVYLAPLRLLALEIQETLLGQGVICSMLTGEEEDVRPGATHISSTVEKLDINRKYDVAVIDECQMITDLQRGFAWTRAILGVQADEVHLCVAPEGLDIVKWMIEDMKESYKVVYHERKVPLRWQTMPVSLKQAKAGDAFVAFSKKSVLQMAETLRLRKMPASVIYGDLPYSTRRQQMQRFLDKETTVLVATDAIGMGLNLPIRRVIFTADTKFDGVERRPLKAAEVRQIAGRAGRFGIYDEGYAAVAPDCQDMEEKLSTVPPQASYASLGFSDLVLKVDFPLADVLRVWNQMPVKAPYLRMDISRYIYIISVLQSELRLGLSKEDLLRAGNIPFDEKNPALLALFKKYAKAYANGAATVDKPILKGNYLSQLETYYKMLDLYYSFSKVYALDYDKEWLDEEKQMIADEINHLLIHELSQRGASCRICGRHLSLNSRYGICEACHQRQVREKKQAAHLFA